MEALALRRLMKENELAKIRVDEESEHKMSQVYAINSSNLIIPLITCKYFSRIICVEQKEIDELNRQFGYPEAPSTVCAIGRSGSAAVWWLMGEPAHEEGLIGLLRVL